MLKALGSGVAEMEREQTVSAQVWGARRAEDLPSTIPYWRLYPRMVRVPRQRRFMNIKRTKVSDGDDFETERRPDRQNFGNLGLIHRANAFLCFSSN
jgi:hypothetical protein